MNGNPNNGRPRPGTFQNPSSRPFQPVPYTEDEHHRIQTLLNRVLGPEYVSFRPGGNGQNVSYIEGWKALNLANEIFGFNGWSSELISSQVDFFDVQGSSGRISMGLSVVVRITIKDGTFHEDFGYGYIDNAKNKAMAFEKCKKEAFTDGLKRCLRCFGNVLGNCLYDRQIISKIQKVKLPPPELDGSDFHRDPLIVKRELMRGETTRVSINQTKQPNKPTENEKGQTINGHNRAGRPSTTPAQAPAPKAPIDLADFDDLFVFSDDLQPDEEMNDGIDDYDLELIRERQEKASLEDVDPKPSQIPSTVTFVNAKQADRIRDAPEELANLPQYNTKFVSTSIRRTVDPSRSVPVKRTDVGAAAGPVELSQNGKRMLGMPPSQRPKRANTAEK